MKFQRNARIFRGQIDAAPFAGVFFLLVLFVLLASLVNTPGVRVRLPVADLPGIDQPSVAVAVDAQGRFYYRNQLVEPGVLRERLLEAARGSVEPLVLVVQADKAATHETLIRLTLLAREAGILETFHETLPRPFASPLPSALP